MPVTALLKSSALLFALTISPALLAYGGGGGGGGGSSCEEPQFSRASPANNASIPGLSSFSVETSANTDLSTLAIQINGESVQPVITPLRSGDALAEVKLATPITTPGKARITLRARSKEGCENFQPIYVEIKP